MSARIFLVACVLCFITGTSATAERAGSGYFNYDTPKAAHDIPAATPNTQPPNDEDGSTPSSGSATVTSVNKCLDALDPAQAAEIRAKAVRPYEECLKRTAAQKSETGDKESAPGPAPETPENFVRVSKEKDEDKKSQETKAPQ